MIGMTFGAFLALLIISAIWSAIVHGSGYRVLTNAEGYCADLIVGWIGGWLGSPVFGYWGGHIAGSNVYLIPAVLGSISLIFMSVAVMRALSTLFSVRAMPTGDVETRRVA